MTILIIGGYCIFTHCESDSPLLVLVIFMLCSGASLSKCGLGSHVRDDETFIRFQCILGYLSVTHDNSQLFEFDTVDVLLPKPSIVTKHNAIDSWIDHPNISLFITI